MQGITGNPLVSPFTVGISSAAALGASLAILFGVPLIGAAFQTTFVIMAAFLFAMANTVFVFLLSRLKSSSPATLVLAGTALTYLTGAVTSVLHFFASEEDLKAMIHWTFGTFTGTTWNMVAIVSAVIVVCLPLLFKQAWNLNAMTAGGDDFAKSLGINTSRVRIISLIISALITATIISFTGVIGFICLVAPHIARFIIGGDHRFLLPGACIFGAILTVGSDLVGRTILSPIILPISIVVSFVGVPLFLYLVLRSKNDYWKK
jgi:iron complex transport system permease protein